MSKSRNVVYLPNTGNMLMQVGLRLGGALALSGRVLTAAGRVGVSVSWWPGLLWQQPSLCCVAKYVLVLTRVVALQCGPPLTCWCRAVCRLTPTSKRSYGG